MNNHRCPNCQSEIPEQASFCPVCGSSLEPEKEESKQPAANQKASITCPRCQTIHTGTGSNFCENCGFPLSGKAQPETIQQVISDSESGGIESTPIPVPSSTGQSPTPAPTLIPQPTDKRTLPRWILALFGFIVVGGVVFAIWYFFLDREPSTCVPERPGEEFQEANQNDLQGDLRQNSYFKSGQEYTIAANNTFTVPDGVKLIIEPGARLRFGEGSKMVVSGTLSACGRSNRRILFTANASTGSPGFWSGLEFVNADKDSALAFATFEYAGRDGHAPVWIDRTDFILHELKFDSNAWYAISLDPNSYPQIEEPLNVENGPQGWEIRSGELTTDKTWDNQQVYIVRELLTIAENGSLELKPGTVVKFLPNGAINVRGVLQAIGETNHTIRFTSYNDDSEDDSQAPESGDWVGLRFYGQNGQSRLENVDITYGGQGGYREVGCVWMENASPQMINVTMNECSGFAMSTDIASEPLIERLSISESDPLRRWEMRQSTLEDVGSRHLTMLSTDDQAPLYPVITGWVGVGENATLTIDPGISLLFFGEKNSGMWVDGTIQANGNQKEPLILTSWRDPEFNRDGGAQPGDWVGLHLKNSRLEDTYLNYIEIRNAGAGNSGCLRLNAASPKIDNIRISDCSYYPISSDASSQPQISVIDINENQLSNQWEIWESSLSGQVDWEWDILRDKEENPIERVITGNIQIGPEAGLIIKPGVILKFTSGKGMLAQGSLQVLGEQSQPIILTSWQDLDGSRNGGSAQAGDWAGLGLEGRQSAKRLENVQIRFAGNPNRGVGCLNLMDSNPDIVNLTITNCSHYPITSDLASDPVIDGLQMNSNSPANEWAYRESKLSNGEQRTWNPIRQADNSADIYRVATGWLNLESGAQLTINRGTVVKFSERTGFSSNGGSLVVEGDLDTPVIFTSRRDPQFSSEGGVQTGDWIGIVLDNVNGSSILRNMEIRYAGANHRQSAAISLTSSSPRIENVVIRDSAAFPVSLDVISNPQVAQIRFENNSPANAIEIRGGQLEAAGEQTWSPWYDADGNPLVRVITETLSIGEPASLRLEPGTLLKFSQNSGIDVHGSLFADEAVFTSLFDDTQGGDTDGGANEESVWQGIRLFNTQPTIIDDSLIKFGQYGIWLENASADLNSTTIENAIEAAISTDLNSEVTVNDLSLQSNLINGILMRLDILPQGETRWSTIGESGNYIPRVVNEPFEIGPESSLTIEPGVVIKFAPGGGMIVNGGLIARGSDNEWVTFTALEDDSMGGDTDGFASNPNRGSWLGIDVNSNLTNAQLELIKTEIRFATNGIHLTELPEWLYDDLAISESQFFAVSCDELSYFDPLEGKVNLVNNGLEMESCPTPDRETSSP